MRLLIRILGLFDIVKRMMTRTGRSLSEAGQRLCGGSLWDLLRDGPGALKHEVWMRDASATMVLKF